MYYKIENKESEVYKKLLQLRQKEVMFEHENRQTIKKKIGLKFINTLGHHGQQSFFRVSTYSGFEFLEKEKVDLKTWKIHKDHKEIYVPNLRTKTGREMQDFLDNGLQKSNFKDVFSILGLKMLSRFTFPFVSIQGETIILMLGNNQEPNDKNIIEITKKEFNEILKQL